MWQSAETLSATLHYYDKAEHNSQTIGYRKNLLEQNTGYLFVNAADQHLMSVLALSADNFAKF